MLREWIAQEKVREKWFTAAMNLEGLPRNASTHAAGVVLQSCTTCRSCTD